MNIKKYFLFLVLSHIGLLGCNTTATQSTGYTATTIWDNAQEYAAKGQYKDAWNALENTPPNLTIKTKQFLQDYPAVYDAGKQVFTIDGLTKLKQDSYQITYAYKRLDEFSIYANTKDKKWAEKNIKKVYGPRPVSYAGTGSTTTKGISGIHSSTHYGRVAGVQVVNRSHINTGAGSNMGALAGQAMYLDNISWRNYSAMNQLGAGLLGAMVGSALDTPTSIAFERKYWVTLNDGNTVAISTTGSDNTHIPQGVCVAVYGSSLEPTNEINCKKKN